MGVTLEELMGDSYKEDMTTEEVQNFFKNKTLESGNYVNIEKAKSNERKLKEQISSLNSQLGEKLSAEEKKQKQDEENQKLIEKLQNQLTESLKTQSRLSAEGKMANVKSSLKIEDNDKEYNSFLDNITFEDKEKTTKISEYVSKLVNKAYEAGKTSSVKKDLGTMGNFKVGENSNSENNMSIGAKLGKEASKKVDLKQYFKNM